jgi:hypothetical protein
METSVMKRLPPRSRAAQQRRLLVSFEQAAQVISAEILQRHLPFGTILDPIFASPQSDEIVAYSRAGDSAIWTGHYLAAEAFRFAATGAPGAFENVVIAIENIHSLIEVTGGSLLARARIPADSPFAAGILQEEAPNGIYESRIGNRSFHWIGNTSRDQYLGVFFGLSVAYERIPHLGVRGRIRELVTRMLDFLIGNAWNVALPNGAISTSFLQRSDQLLSLLQVGRQVNPQRFDQTYQTERFFRSLRVVVPVTFDVLDDHNSYFKFNLDAIALFNLIRLEEPGTHRNRYFDAYDVLRRTVDDHGNAHFNLIDRALRGPDPSRDAETFELLRAWLLRPRRDFFVDLRSVTAACGENRACQPIPVEQRVRSDFLWQRSPFQLSGGGDGFIENAGLDFLLPFWMSRAYALF